MKALLMLVLLVGIGAFAFLTFQGSSKESSKDPTQQGREARATIETCKTWTEVLERAGEPRKWRKATSDFDFNYSDRFNETTRESIVGMLKENELRFGFSFLYRFSDAVTFAVNFDAVGAMTNIQDREGQNALMDAAGG